MFYKTFYKDSDGAGGVSADTKLRRETLNFKMNFTPGTYIPDPNSDNPTEPIQGLLQILPKNLAPEDFIGMITRIQLADGRLRVETTTEVQCGDDMMELVGGAIYIPSTGYVVDDKYGTSDGEGGEGGGNL